MFEKDGHVVSVNSKFIYCISLYKIFNGRGFFLIKESHYSCDKPIKFKKNTLNKKGYTILRTIDLEAAPEEYLINNNYKPI